MRTVVQLDGMDENLRVSLWNALTLGWVDELPEWFGENDRILMAFLWDFLGWHVDTVPDTSGRAVARLKEYFFGAEWFLVYDLTEEIVHIWKNDFLPDLLNSALEREVAGYRIVVDKIVPISSEEELVAVEEALRVATPLKPVHTHLTAALDHLADRTNPDYRNSIKESISAVEALCRLLAGGNATLGQALNEIEKAGALHGALKSAFSSLYGYTSDASGIRHALLEESVLDLEDAKFMLVACSGFINYMAVKAAKLDLGLG